MWKLALLILNESVECWEWQFSNELRDGSQKAIKVGNEGGLGILVVERGLMVLVRNVVWVRGEKIVNLIQIDKLGVKFTP